MQLKWIVSVCLALAALPARAHDVWIEPSSFDAALGQTVGLQLRVGQDLQGEPLALVEGLVKRFVVQDSAALRPVRPQLRAATAGLLRVATPGLQVVGYHSHPSFIDLPAEKFNGYLAEEGLDGVLAQRAQLGQSQNNGRELYARCAKTLLRSGEQSAAMQDRALGFALELVAERNPYVPAPGQALPVRLTFEGKALAGTLVVAINGSDAALKQSARTDSEGRVHLRVDGPGLWLIKAVHMVPAPAGYGADWSSLWASLTFEGSMPNSASGKPPSALRP